MGLFDFFKSKSPEEIFTKRWVPLTDGTIADSEREGEIAWRVSTNSFEKLFQGIEARLGQSLGRRLAHAAAESEEYLLSLKGGSRPRGRDSKSWSGLHRDWMGRGIGKLESLDDGEEIRLLVSGSASAPICAGFATSSWEYLTGQRHRFRWSQSSQEGLVINLELDGATIPQAQKTKQNWLKNYQQIPDLQTASKLIEDLEINEDGRWFLMGIRTMFIHRDLILKFEEYCLPYLDEIHEGRRDYNWSNLDENRHAWWTVMADTQREIFYSTGHHIFVSDVKDWLMIARRHLSMDGLGKITTSTALDANGGVEFLFGHCFHPALVCGVLLGCWERAYGRRGKVDLAMENGNFILKINSLSEIA